MGSVALDVMTDDKANRDALSDAHENESGSGEPGKALLVGLLGGIVSAAGYLVYQRLPPEQKDRINRQVRSTIENRLTELRQNLNI